MAISYNETVSVGNIDLTIGTDVGGGWLDNGLSMTLPQEGIYLIHGTFSVGHGDGSVFDNHWVLGRLFDVTNNAVVAGSQVYLLTATNLASNGDLFINTGAILVNYRITAPVEIHLQTSLHSISSSCSIEGASSNFGYVLLHY